MLTRLRVAQIHLGIAQIMAVRPREPNRTPTRKRRHRVNRPEQNRVTMNEPRRVSELQERDTLFIAGTRFPDTEIIVEW